MPLTTPVVPMPKWSTPVGCTKLILSIIVLAFVAACTAIWGAHLAFRISIFTASISLLVFSYYLTALSFRPRLYSKYLVLGLETFLTVFWLISLVLLVGLSGESGPHWVVNAPAYYESTPETATTGLSGRGLSCDTLSLASSPLALMKRQGTWAPETPIGIHGQDAQGAARILAGISAGLAGITFILYTITLATFSINFHKAASDNSTGTDEEALPTPLTRPTTLAPAAAIQPGILLPPAVAQPVRVETLPKDFEPKPQTQEHDLTPEQASEAGIQAPTSILKAQIAEKDKTADSKEEDKALTVPETAQAEDPVSAVRPLEEKEK